MRMSQASQDFVPLAQRTKKTLKPRRLKKPLVAVVETKTNKEQEGFEDLAKRTKLTIDEVGNQKNCEFSWQVRTQHDQFMSSCPEGLMTKDRFLELSRCALGAQADFLSEALFR